MQTKKSPMRMCIACREMKEKQSLIRIVKTENDIIIDYKGKTNGRGAYVCNDIDCIKKCVKTKALNRAFKTEISQQTYDKLLEDFIEQNS